MFERFGTWGRQVIVAAQEEARSLRHPALGPEHLLLGLLRDEHGVGGDVLRGLGLTYERQRADVEARLGIGERATAGPIPYTPQAQHVLEQAMREAMALGHDGISSEHVLLALAREGSVPGVDGQHVREEVLRVLGSGDERPGGRDEVPAPEVHGATAAGAREAIGAAGAPGASRLGSPWDVAVQAHLLLGLLAAGGPVADHLRAQGVTEASVRALAGDPG